MLFQLKICIVYRIRSWNCSELVSCSPGAGEQYGRPSSGGGGAGGGGGGGGGASAGGGGGGGGGGGEEGGSSNYRRIFTEEQYRMLAQV